MTHPKPQECELVQLVPQHYTVQREIQAIDINLSIAQSWLKMLCACYSRHSMIAGTRRELKTTIDTVVWDCSSQAVFHPVLHDFRVLCEETTT